jgi:hypothetical protein
VLQTFHGDVQATMDELAKPAAQISDSCQIYRGDNAIAKADHLDIIKELLLEFNLSAR